MKRGRLIVVSLIGAVASIALGGCAWVYSLGPPPHGGAVDYSHIVLDRDGRLLRAYATPDGRWRLPAKVKDVDPRFLNLLFAYEDKRFRTHHGIDPLALGRAALQFSTSGHIVSGGSTLTMQVARLLEPRQHRSFGAKLRQLARALQLEIALGKDDILALYLTLAPYGGNLEGIRAASLSYFGKEPRRLTLGEAALLVALPQSPEWRRPDRNPAAARAARDRVLDRAAAAGALPSDDVARAKFEPVPTERKQLPMLAAHAADQVVAAEPDRRVHRLTIDAGLQKTLQNLARERARALGPDISVAILAVDNAGGEVRARIASADYFDARRAGQVDMTQALRSPGSTLKPFIYGLGFEDGLLHPETLIDDRPARYGSYTPENFDLTFQGTVTVRRALQLSLNVPAIAVLGKVGVSRLSARLTQTGAALVLPKGEAPGLAMGLGGVGIRLTDLVMLYSGLARQGLAAPLIERVGVPSTGPRRLLDPVAAWYVGNILIGAPPPDNAPHGRIAFKTGTSYGYRDAWAVGFDGRMTIGVWVGRPDGAPVPGLVGRAAAAPILFDAFARSGLAPAPLPRAPKGTVFAATSTLPPPLQRFGPAAASGGASEPPRIMFPPAGARIEWTSSQANEPVALKIAGGLAPLTVMVNGVPLSADSTRRTLFFQPDGPGFVRLTVMDARGAADSVMVRVQ
ncbi:MAG: penicillin-binding protein 1C [Rhizobiales bacterium]|nr:penicillin-binding protein 1C [Hyphomicrobiales bacterium]